jgi:hypothetical protein
MKVESSAYMGVLNGAGKVSLIFALSALLVGCGNSAATSAKTTTQQTVQTVDTTYIYSSLHWDTSGGGDLHFDVAPTGERDTFVISSVVSGGTTIPERLTLSPASNAQLAAEVGQIFRGLNANWTYQTGGGYGGSWTSLVLTKTNGQTQTLSNLNTYSHQTLSALYNFVDSQI